MPGCQERSERHGSLRMYAVPLLSVPGAARVESGAGETVSDAGDRSDAARRRPQPELLADVTDVGLQQVGIAAIVAPGILDQARVGNDSPLVHGEHVQDPELERGELDVLARLRHLVRLKVEVQIAHA